MSGLLLFQVGLCVRRRFSFLVLIGWKVLFLRLARESGGLAEVMVRTRLGPAVRAGQCLTL